MYRFFSVLVIVCVAFIGGGCSTNPATGKMQFNMMSEQQEISLGSEAAPQFLESYGGPIPSPEIRAYVDEIGKKLAATSERPDLPWEFFVVDSSVINAFALPGGKVFFSRGLLVDLKDESMLAAVLGHEIGHVTAQHIGQQISRQQAAQIGLAVTAAVLGATTSEENAWLATIGVQGAQAGASVYLLKFGRDQESEADDLGLRYMTNLNYDPQGMLGVMYVLKEASGGGGGVEWLSTHPLPDTRISRVSAAIGERYPDAAVANTYVRNEARFQATVLDRIKALPAPKHTGQEATGCLPAPLEALALRCRHCGENLLAKPN